jgi:hypothetical protein
MRYDDYTFCTRCDHYVADYIYSADAGMSDSAPTECNCTCHPA